MGNKVRFKMRKVLQGTDQINVAVFSTSYEKLWSGTTIPIGADVLVDIGDAGTGGDNVWVYGNNSSVGNESVSKIIGGYSSIEAGSGWYDQITGMVSCSSDLIECNEEQILCL